jgi:hypothetical protein
VATASREPPFAFVGLWHLEFDVGPSWIRRAQNQPVERAAELDTAGETQAPTARAPGREVQCSGGTGLVQLNSEAVRKCPQQAGLYAPIIGEQRVPSNRDPALLRFRLDPIHQVGNDVAPSLFVGSGQTRQTDEGPAHRGLGLLLDPG